MKLYYAPGACSLSPHIALREAGLAFTLEKVDLKTRTLAGGGDYLAVNPKGYVPALQLDNGDVLTEGPAIVQYVADQRPQSGLAPAAGTPERYRLAEWLNFITSELHKSYSPLFSADAAAGWKDAARSNIARHFASVDFPEPDSPTMPRVAPSATPTHTESSARTVSPPRRSQPWRWKFLVSARASKIILPVAFSVPGTIVNASHLSCAMLRDPPMHRGFAAAQPADSWCTDALVAAKFSQPWLPRRCFHSKIRRPGQRSSAGWQDYG